MRITGQLLKKFSSSPVEEVKYLDLSGKEIVAIERLGPCRRLQTLVLCSNTIDSIRNVECCRQLWNLDLTGNRVKTLHGLSRFPVMGVLGLGCNELDWQEVRRLSHIHLLSLSLLGNTKLDSDPHYRKHVIDLLPHLWMLDGRIITAEERKQVARFFAKSEASPHPVWRKATESVLVPSCMKNLLVTGVFGEKTTHMMARFPVNYVHNVEMDKKRLMYLAYTFEEEIKLEICYKKRRSDKGEMDIPQLVRLLECRREEVEQCNMLLLLLVATLEFDLPLEVMKATLETAKLTKIGEVGCMEIFNLPAHMMLDVASLLLSAADVDRREKKEGGLYQQLYQSLCCNLENVHRKILALNRPEVNTRKLSQAEEAVNSHLRCLLASEVVHLMCLVPLFFESMETNEGLMEMVSVATKNPLVADVMGSIAWKVQQRGGDVWEVYHDIASYLLQSTSENVLGKKRHRFRHKHSSHVHRTISQVIESTQPRSHPRAARALSAGAIGTRPRALATRSAHMGRSREPELGDLVLVNPEKVARIIALPETSVAVLQLNPSSSSLTGPPDSYFYTDTHSLVWDRQLGCWTRDSLEADFSTSCLNPSPEPPPSTCTLPTLPSTISLEVSRTTTPEPHFAPPPPLRPHSQLSFVSDDLQTIPSQDELEADSSIFGSSFTQQPPMTVDICDRPGSVRGKSLSQEQAEAKLDHQRRVLHQYTVNQEDSTEDKSSKQSATSNTSPPTVTTPEPFTVPTPQVHLMETWSSSKSFPTTTYTKSHSCQQSEKEIAKLEAYSQAHNILTSPTPPKSPTSHSTIPSLSLKSTTLQVTPAHNPPQPVYNAWTAVKPGTQARHTMSPSTRLMSKRQPKIPTLTAKQPTATGLFELQSSRAYSVTLHHEPLHLYYPSPGPPHVTAYTAHARLGFGYQHFEPRKSSRAPGRRKLGDVRSLYIGGTSIH